MQDWVGLLSSIIQLLAAIMIYLAAGKEGNKKGTKHRRRGKR
ncbi:hypothetical protein [Paenibacillus sp. 1011MAR3C5]|nr:hypothetical protein [Paenibacillus sp. 1011MAR3C5]